MPISKRRLEFLRALYAANAMCGGPVHYSVVGERIGVSKWTAYDMMKELANDGLAIVSYSTMPSGFRGRSQVLFSITPEGVGLLGNDEPLPADPHPHEIAQTTDSGFNLRVFINAYRDASPLAFCTVLLTLLVTEFRRQGLKLATLRIIVESGADASAMLLLLFGALASVLLSRGTYTAMGDAHLLVEHFADEIKNMSVSNQRLLASTAAALLEGSGP